MYQVYTKSTNILLGGFILLFGFSVAANVANSASVEGNNNAATNSTTTAMPVAATPVTAVIAPETQPETQVVNSATPATIPTTKETTAVPVASTAPATVTPVTKATAVPESPSTKTGIAAAEAPASNAATTTHTSSNVTLIPANEISPAVEAATPTVDAATPAVGVAATTTPIVYEEGKHYQKLAAKITSKTDIQQLINADPGKIQVLEFFNYGCFWCSRLHPMVNKWLESKPDNIKFYRFPVNFHPGWDKFAKAYYIIEQLGKSQEWDKEVFEAVKANAELNVSEEKILKDFFAKQGIQEAQYNELFNSFAVNHAYSRGNQIANAYQISLSPVIVVNSPKGSYLITATMVGTEQGVIDVLNYILKEKT